MKATQERGQVERWKVLRYLMLLLSHQHQPWDNLAPEFYKVNSKIIF